jgi:hypothetical protein
MVMTAVMAVLALMPPLLEPLMFTPLVLPPFAAVM